MAGFTRAEAEVERETGVAPADLVRCTMAASTVARGMGIFPILVTESRKKVSADDIRAKQAGQGNQADLKYREIKVGDFTIYDPDSIHSHSEAFVVVGDSTFLESWNADGLRKILERGKPASFASPLQIALKGIDTTKTFIYAIDVKTILADQNAARLLKGYVGPAIAGLRNGEFLKQVASLSLDAGLVDNDASIRATLVCTDAQTAGDAKKIAESVQVIIHKTMQDSPRVPKEVSDAFNSVTFSVEGRKSRPAVRPKSIPW